MIYALGEHANAFCREAPQKCASTFIDGRNIENEMHCFTVPNGLLATGLQHINACRRDFPGNCQTGSLFAEFFIYSKHNPASASRFPFLIRSNFLDSALSHLPKPSASAVAKAEYWHCRPGSACIDIASDPTR
jgi:hypothetical protein